MKLTLDKYGERDVANEAGLREALALLDGEGNSFAILGEDGESYI